MRAILFLSTFFLLNPLFSREPLSVVIIGGGPAGLATALEANAAGANVILVEKREEYTRNRFVFLLESSLEFLDTWNISLPWLIRDDFEGDAYGLTTINSLEVNLARKVEELGIPRILGEFKELEQGKVTLQNPYMELHYDILVGADGMHSTVRDALGFSSKQMGEAVASIAVFPRHNETIEFILPFWADPLFLNKITIPTATVIFAQGKELSKELVYLVSKELNWTSETDLFFTDQVRYVDNFEVILQQSTGFSDFTKSSIILGDAAATGSFLQGKGANSALSAAKLAGVLFKSELLESDYASFNAAMQSLTDDLIQDSAYLFE